VKGDEDNLINIKNNGSKTVVKSDECSLKLKKNYSLFKKLHSQRSPLNSDDIVSKNLSLI